MISTKELAEACGKSLKSITEWAKKNNVSKSGRLWDFTSEDCQKLFEYYGIDPNELPITLSNEAVDPNELKLPSNEPETESSEPSEPASKDANEANELLNNPNEPLIEAYKEQIEILKEQVKEQKERLKEKSNQITELIKSNRELSASIRALGASNAMHTIADKQDVLSKASIQEVEEEIIEEAEVIEEKPIEQEKKPWYKVLFADWF